MFSNDLTTETKSCLKKIDDLSFYFERYQDYEIKCKELKNSLDALELRCERYKRYCEEMESHSQGDIEAFYQDFQNLNCKVSEFICDYNKLKQDIEECNFKDFAFLIDTKRTKEIADQCWEEGYAIIESDEKLQLKFIIAKNKLKQEVVINQEECRKDKQLIAEKILQELGKIKEGRKNKQIREDLELVGKLINSSQLLKVAKEKYCKLEEIFNRSNEILNSMQVQVDQLDKNFSSLCDEVKKISSSDGIMEPIVQDHEKTREILEKILTEKEKRKEKGPLDAERETVNWQMTGLEKEEKKIMIKKDLGYNRRREYAYQLMKSLSDQDITYEDVEKVMNSEGYQRGFKESFSVNFKETLERRIQEKSPIKSRLQKKIITKKVEDLENRIEKEEENYKELIKLLQKNLADREIEEASKKTLKHLRELKQEKSKIMSSISDNIAPSSQCSKLDIQAAQSAVQR